MVSILQICMQRSKTPLTLPQTYMAAQILARVRRLKVVSAVMLFPAFLLLAHGEKSFAPAVRPMMPRGNAAVAATPAAVPAAVPHVPMQQGAAPSMQPASEGRSSAVMMASNALIYSGLSAKTQQPTTSWMR